MLFSNFTNLIVSDDFRDFNVDSDIFGGACSRRIWLLVKVILIHIVLIILLRIILAVVVIIVFIVIVLISVIQVVIIDVILVNLIILIGSRRWRSWGSFAALIRVFGIF